MARKVRIDPDREPRSQVAALPWRFSEDGEVEVLLITTRATRRWVIPKGWPIKGLTSAQAAAQEAFEEAGVTGGPSKKKIGVYEYDKRLASGRMEQIRVSVYGLKVDEEHAAWPEAGQRQKLWAAPAAAADMVCERALAGLIRTFGQI
jgi:8-oxo-dGTP pyrophosphatase MutT (NUDIX family)